MWDRSMGDKFQWRWKDATTFDRYDVETASNKIVLVETGDGARVSGAENVLHALNDNSRKIFRLLAMHQLQVIKEKGAANKEGDDRDEDDDDGRSVDDKEQDEDEDESEDEESRKKRKSGGKRKRSKASEFDMSLSGLPFKSLFQLCIENFAATNSDTFRAQLGEFKDHKIILTRKNAQNQEILYIPFDADSLKTLVKKCEN
jgi:origin recognition complex subunit 2